MANRNQLLNLVPFETKDLGRAAGVPTPTSPHSPPEDILQLQTDVINVLEGRVDITSFEPSYQKRIKDYYRFSATVQMSKTPIIMKWTCDTLDLV